MKEMKIREVNVMLWIMSLSLHNVGTKRKIYFYS